MLGDHNPRIRGDIDEQLIARNLRALTYLIALLAICICVKGYVDIGTEFHRVLDGRTFAEALMGRD